MTPHPSPLGWAVILAAPPGLATGQGQYLALSPEGAGTNKAQGNALGLVDVRWRKGGPRTAPKSLRAYFQGAMRTQSTAPSSTPFSLPSGSLRVKSASLSAAKPHHPGKGQAAVNTPRSSALTT